MAWRLVVQPSGLYARFSEVVDDFTHYDMTKEDAWTLCRDEGGCKCADDKIARANAALERYEESMQIIRTCHGDDTEKERRNEIK